MPQVDSRLIDEMEAQIRLGNYRLVRDFLRTVSRSEIPDRLVLRVSQLSRRIDHGKKGLMLLRERVVDVPVGQSCDPHEEAEYAACLLKMGAVAEARRLLASIDPKKAPEALKYLAFTYIHQWDYEATIPLLEKYVSLSEVAAYDRLVGSVNLGAALVHVDRHEEAAATLEPLLEQAEREGHRLILGNVSELLAQTYIHLGDFGRANDYLRLSAGSLNHAQPRYRLYLESWSAIGRLTKRPGDPSALDDLKKTRKEAHDSALWEIVRECDFHQSLLANDETLFSHLYFGTPYPAFRAKMLRKAEGRLKIPNQYRWGRDNSLRTLDIDSACDAEGRRIVNKGQAVHRVAKALSLDFYAPAMVAELFAHVFANERFHPETSPERIYELVRRLRAALSQNGFEIAIESMGRGYKLMVPESQCSLIVTAERSPVGGLLQEIQSHFPETSFRLRELADRIGIPHTTVYREVKRLVSTGELSVIGEGAKTLYSLRTANLAGSPASASHRKKAI